MVQEDLEDLGDPRNLWVLEGRVDLVDQKIQEPQELLAIRAIPLLLSLRNGWWRSHHPGLPLDQADQVDPVVLAVRRFPHFLGDPSHPLSRCNLALLLGLEVRPARVDPGALAFLGILAAQPALLFLLDRVALEVHRYPSLLWIRLGPQVRGIQGLRAVR